MSNPYTKAINDGFAKKKPLRSTVKITAHLQDMNDSIREATRQVAKLAYQALEPNVTNKVELVCTERLLPRAPYSMGGPIAQERRTLLFEIKYGYHTEHDEVTLRYHGEEKQVNLAQIVPALCEILSHSRTISMLEDAMGTEVAGRKEER